MTRFGIVGDLHGNDRWANTVLYEMGRRKIQHVFVVGDCGLWSGFEGVQYLDRVQESAKDNRLTVFFIPGNHDNYDILEHYQAHAPRSHGFSYLRERVLMCGKANSFKMFGKRFVVAGGAVSIDKEWRLEKERGIVRDPFSGYVERAQTSGTGPRTLWWPQEQLTDEEEEAIKSYGKCDILLSHDCSDNTAWKSRLKPDMDSQTHRQRIDRIIAAVKPEVHFHGHMHTKYEWVNTRSHGFYDTDEPGAFGTQTYGLECDGMNDSWGIYDTDLNVFDWRGAELQYRSLIDFAP